MDAAALLRPELLRGTRVIVTEPRSSLGEACARACSGRGADVRALPAGGDDEARDDELAAVAATLLPEPSSVVLAVDGAGLFTAGSGPEDSLRRCLDGAWDAARAVIAAGLIPSGRGGRAILLGPPPGAGEGALAARRGLEAMARTLSIEWSPHPILTVAVLPGDRTTADELAGLVALLCSPAGDYFSGCRLELGARPVSRPA